MQGFEHGGNDRRASIWRSRAIVRVGGKRRTAKSAPLRRDAVAAGAKLEAEMRAAQIADQTAPDRPETLSDVVEALPVGKDLAESTRSDCRRVSRKLSEFDPTVPATKVDAIDAAWVDQLYSRLADHITPVELIEPTKPKSGPTRTRPMRPPRAADKLSKYRIRRVHEVCAEVGHRQTRVDLNAARQRNVSPLLIALPLTYHPSHGTTPALVRRVV